jgi:hypothetical protein
MLLDLCYQVMQAVPYSIHPPSTTPRVNTLVSGASEISVVV